MTIRPRKHNRVIPAISKGEISGMAGFTITTGDAEPSESEDIRTRELMSLGGSMGFNTVRWFMNVYQLREAVKMLRADNPLCLPLYARQQHLTPILDTVDRQALHLDDELFAEAMHHIRSLGFAAVCFNDANQYRERKNGFGRLYYPVGTLESLVKRVRIAAPDLVIFASVTATAKAYQYRELFDYVEIQSFGTLNDFKQFQTYSYDWLCLDGRNTAKPRYLTSILNTLLASTDNNFFVYTAYDAAGTDWRNQPATVKRYTKFLSSFYIPF